MTKYPAGSNLRKKGPIVAHDLTGHSPSYKMQHQEQVTAGLMASVSGAEGAKWALSKETPAIIASRKVSLGGGSSENRAELAMSSSSEQASE